MSETNVDLDDKRVQLDQKLAALKLSPGAADLVRKADAAVTQYRAEADALERELAEVDQQLGVRENDKREAAARQREAQWLAMRQQLLEEEQRRLQAVEDVERATRALAKGVEDLIASNARLSVLARDLSADRKPSRACNPMDLINRMSSRIASVMMTVKGHKHQLGAIVWPSAASGLYPADGPAWKDSEEQRMARELIGPLLEKGKA